MASYIMMSRHHVTGARITRSDVAGVITKEHIADSVADSVKIYPQ